MKNLFILLSAFLLFALSITLIERYEYRQQSIAYKDSTAYWKGRYDSALILTNRMYDEMNKEIKYWKDTSFFYCGKYYEQLHIHSAQGCIKTYGDHSPAIISDKSVIIHN